MNRGQECFQLHSTAAPYLMPPPRFRPPLHLKTEEPNFRADAQRQQVPRGRQGLAIGSGITEAACKTLFTQRFKQSGMKWSLEGGQVVVNLRVIWLSQLWSEVFDAYLQQLPQSQQRTKDRIQTNCHKIAA